jgi:CBS domain-containing protein/gas vesicle protein
MVKAREIMTGSLLTCSPKDSVADAARIMRDRNTGDVLVTDDGKLVGIVTDRDIAVRLAAKGLDPVQVPVKHVMSKHVVSGQPNWEMDKIAKTMGQHQVRRLPIIEHGLLVGIISLGDVALRNGHTSQIAKSLKAISEPVTIHRAKGRGGRLLMTLGLGLLTGAVIALTMSPKSFNALRDQIRDSDIGDKLTDWMEQGRERLTELAEEGSDRMADLAQQGREKLSDQLSGMI